MQNTENNNAPAINWALLILRIFLGVIFMAHGAQKLFGAFGGPGLGPIVQSLGPVGYLVAVGEFFGGLGILVGFLSRFSSAALVVIMIGAIQKVHGANGFFLPGGYEFNVALIGMALPILIAGPGSFGFTKILPKKTLPYLE